MIIRCCLNNSRLISTFLKLQSLCDELYWELWLLRSAVSSEIYKVSQFCTNICLSPFPYGHTSFLNAFLFLLDTPLNWTGLPLYWLWDIWMFNQTMKTWWICVFPPPSSTLSWCVCTAMDDILSPSEWWTCCFSHSLSQEEINNSSITDYLEFEV